MLFVIPMKSMNERFYEDVFSPKSPQKIFSIYIYICAEWNQTANELKASISIQKMPQQVWKLL